LFFSFLFLLFFDISRPSSHSLEAWPVVVALCLLQQFSFWWAHFRSNTWE
jgi:hypothetical protein